MPLFYDHVSIAPYGVISAHDFVLPMNGRRVYFDLPNGGLQQQLYTVIDGQLTSFQNGDAMQTPRRGVERLMSLPHPSQLLVVQSGVTHLSDMVLPLNPVSVLFSSGEYGLVKLQCYIRASVRVCNTMALAEDFVNGKVTCAEETACSYLKRAAQDAINSLLPVHFHQYSVENAISSISALTQEIEREAIDLAQRYLSWLEVTAFECPLTLENADELLKASNRMFELSIENQRKLLEAVLTVYGKSPMPAEVGQILLGYTQSNPGVSSTELLNVCQGLKQLCERSTPEKLLLTAQNMGLTASYNKLNGGP